MPNDSIQLPTARRHSQNHTADKAREVVDIISVRPLPHFLQKRFVHILVPFASADVQPSHHTFLLSPFALFTIS